MEIVITLCPDFHPTRQSAEFYCDGDSHAWVGTVYDGERSLHIYCDGEMRLYDAAADSDGSRLWNSYELTSRGYDTDKKLDDAIDESRLVVHNNPWFSLYDDDHELVNLDVFHGVSDAIHGALNEVHGIKG
jgi:hypothetical protein